MRGPVLLTLLLAAAAAHFVVVGLPAHRQADQALAELQQREARFAELERTLPSVSWDEHEALSRATEDLAALGRERLATLLDSSLAEPLPGFEAALAAAPLSALDPLAGALRTQAAAGPRAARALAVVLHVLAQSGVATVAGLELERGGASRPVTGIEGLVALDASLTVVSGLHEGLTLLELLAPGRGEPVLRVRQASLTRVDPGRWDVDGGGPPVKLSIALSVLFADRETEAR